MFTGSRMRRRGFSLSETLVSLFAVSLILTIVMNICASGSRATVLAGTRSQAVAVTRQALDQAVRLGYDKVAPGGRQITLSWQQDGREVVLDLVYQVQVQTLAPGRKSVWVDTSWREAEVVRMVTLETRLVKLP